MGRQPRSETALVAELAQVMACSASPVGAVLDLALSCVGSETLSGAAVLKPNAVLKTEAVIKPNAVIRPNADTRPWSVLATTNDVDAAQVRELAAELPGLLNAHPLGAEGPGARGSAWDSPEPIQHGRSSVIRLCGSGELVGALVLLGCSPAQWSAVPASLATNLTSCMTGAVTRENTRADASLARRSARAIRRLFEEGAPARDVEQAGAVLARVAAEAFQTERAGMYVVDTKGIISFAVGVGISPELSDALAKSLVGKVAADSPVWQTLERAVGPDLVDDASQANIRPGGFVQTLGFVSYAAIPLLSKAGPLGMVICGEASKLRTWTAKERELASQFALEGALIVDAARLRASERDQLARITHEASHDGLTGVANRNLLMTRLDEALATATRRGTRLAMLVLDLNDFKQVNDTLGHRYGDELLREVAVRLSKSVRTGDTVARLGGDEFAILVADDAGLVQAHAVADTVNGLLSVPIDLDGVALNAVASIGIAVFPEHATTATDLVQRADIAMYVAKRSKGGPTVYHHSMDECTVDKLTAYTDLRHAIADGDLRLVYQPKLHLGRNEVVGVEALVRWQHRRRGLLAPDDFLPMAESTGLIHSLTAWVMEQALRQWTEWTRSGVTLDLAVNVSVHNLLDRDLLTYLADLIRHSGAADHLVVEVTETATMLDPKESARALGLIRALGVRISMDDFGTGYSSLTKLRDLPVDELKIDMLVVKDMLTSDLDCALVETIIGLGHRLGLPVVAKGIETAQTMQALRELDCDFGQGFYISRPVSGDHVTKLALMHRLPVGENRTDPCRLVSAARFASRSPADGR